MENNIGVGMIVGLITAGGIYIYNYISNYKEIKVEKAGNKISSQKEDLEYLKKNELINDIEFKEKNLKIRKALVENNFKNSKDYIALKKLFNSGLFSKEEFNLKVEQASEIKLKLLLERDKLKILNDGRWQVFIFDDQSVRFSTSFVDNHNSFTHGNYKAWFLIFEAGFNFKFYTKNSNDKIFIFDKVHTTFFESEEELLYHVVKENSEKVNVTL